MNVLLDWQSGGAQKDQEFRGYERTEFREKDNSEAVSFNTQCEMILFQGILSASNRIIYTEIEKYEILYALFLMCLYYSDDEHALTKSVKWKCS